MLSKILLTSFEQILSQWTWNHDLESSVNLTTYDLIEDCPETTNISTK